LAVWERSVRVSYSSGKSVKSRAKSANFLFFIFINFVTFSANIHETTSFKNFIYLINGDIITSQQPHISQIIVLDPPLCFSFLGASAPNPKLKIAKLPIAFFKFVFTDTKIDLHAFYK